MPDDEKFTSQEWQKKMAVDLFNRVWSLMEKKNRTKEENDTMVHAAHASRYHWGEVGKPVNWARGEWQISRVYSVLKRPEIAQLHAQRYLDLCEEHSLGDFDYSYAYEALARACALAGESTLCQKYLALARKYGEKIENKEHRDMLMRDLKTVPLGSSLKEGPEAQTQGSLTVQMILEDKQRPMTTLEVRRIFDEIGCPDSPSRVLNQLRLEGTIHGKLLVKRKTWIWWAPGVPEPKDE